ncbi:hypothetical protein [Bacteroides heparinolyticus]|uniref:hypothetical protein n=1 Tax=Prevotella heparinolytica TaxID=28113 RepID=UPI0028EB2733|nr:hypothetical protein [Bacteroides heparinolyticus]
MIMETKSFLNEMRAAARNGELRELSISDFPDIIGKRIQTIYFGYAGQDGVDDFTVGELVSLWDLAGRTGFDGFKTQQEYWESYMSDKQISDKQNCLTLLTNEGRDTYINLHQELGNKMFTCSDVDRVVLYRIVP